MVLLHHILDMFWTGILARQIPHCTVPSKHAASKPNGHYLKLETR